MPDNAQSSHLIPTASAGRRNTAGKIHAVPQPGACDGGDIE